jgi:hypothetical protein
MELLNNIPKGNGMNNIGITGFLLSIVLFLTSELLGFLYWLGRLKVETLQEIALYLTIIVSFLTICWHLGNMLMHEQEFRAALKRKIKSLFKK